MIDIPNLQNINTCPSCGKDNFETVDSRMDKSDSYRYRRKRCIACHKTWITVEITQADFFDICDVYDKGLPQALSRSAEMIDGKMDDFIDSVNALAAMIPKLQELQQRREDY